MKIFNLFPLTVMQQTIPIEESERKVLVTEIEKMFKINKNYKR